MIRTAWPSRLMRASSETIKRFSTCVLKEKYTVLNWNVSLTERLDDGLF